MRPMRGGVDREYPYLTRTRFVTPCLPGNQHHRGDTMQLRECLLMDKNWRFHLGDIHMPDCVHQNHAGVGAAMPDSPIAFEVSDNARIIGVGNGDPSSHEPDKAKTRRAFNGLCQVLVQSTTTPGKISIHARARGLVHRELTVTSRRCRHRPWL